MLYHISADLIDPGIVARSPDEFHRLVSQSVRPSVELLKRLEQERVVLAGGVQASSPKLFFIIQLAGTSHLAVRQFLAQLPIYPYYRWEVVPLESVSEWEQFLG
ncbi:MAG: hypothetical protein LC104_15615 [Bacteroidales bacterium]|nr:hypothetical protein [Bacteroidales bacterium]